MKQQISSAPTLDVLYQQVSQLDGRLSRVETVTAELKDGQESLQKQVNEQQAKFSAFVQAQLQQSGLSRVQVYLILFILVLSFYTIYKLIGIWDSLLTKID